MTWAQFVETLNEKYFNVTVIAGKKQEFNVLQQRDMIVIDVVAKFDELAHFCPELVLNEAKMNTRMISILSPKIA